jgi:hypothetical protein
MAVVSGVKAEEARSGTLAKLTAEGLRTMSTK